MAVTRADTNFEIDPIDYGLLAVTNPYRLPNELEPEPFLLTAKDFYVWAHAVGRYLEIRAGLEGCEEQIKLFYQHDFKSNEDGIYETFLKAAFGDHAYGADQGYGGTTTDRQLRLERLERDGLIVDPFVEGLLGIPIIVAGLTPVSSTKRTEKGETVYLRIAALLWEYEVEKTGEYRVVKAYWRMSKAIEILKTHFKMLALQKDGGVKSQDG